MFSTAKIVPPKKKVEKHGEKVALFAIFWHCRYSVSYLSLMNGSITDVKKLIGKTFLLQVQGTRNLIYHP